MNRQQRMVAVVDDDPRVRQSLEGLLDSAGIATRSFGSGEEALQSGMLEEAHCMITDVRMPGMDGCELLRRTAAAFPGLPVIFVSAHHDGEVQRRALSMGAFAFLHKPFDSEELLHIVDAALQGAQNQEEICRISAGEKSHGIA